MQDFTKFDQAKLIGDRVRVRREALGMNKSQLATYAKVSRAYVTRLEKGEYVRSSATHLGKVADALNCSVDDLVGPPSTEEREPLMVPRAQAPAIRRLLDLDIGPQRLWDIVEGLARMFSRSGEEPHEHVFDGHAGRKTECEGEQKT